MGTIRITKEFGEVLRGLQSGDVIVKRPAWEGTYARAYREQDGRWTVETISEELFKQLRRMKLIEKGDARSISYYWYRQVWEVSDAGKAFRLPPPEFWME